MAMIRMLACDLDGTLIGSANEFPLYNNFREKIEELRRTNNIIWAACTGRSLSSFRDFFSPMRMMGIMPDYVIVNHAYIYGIGKYGYMPHLFWNLRIRYLIWASQLYVSEAIDEWHEMITGVSLGVSTLRKKKDHLCLRFDSEESATVAANLLKEKAKPYRHLQVFRYLMEVDVRSVPFTKGLAVSELARHLEIPASEILAIGNGHNDISMMSSNVAHNVGCPANSEDEVIENVHKVGGHIAKNRSLGGVLEIMDAYQTGMVCSDLPSDWVPPSERYNSSPGRSPRERRRKMKTGRIWLFIAVLYVVLTVFASFHLIPFVSGIIKKPFDLFVKLIEKILLLFWQ
ncbi:MAG: HAD family hydrolase [Kiritimatiellae bacterium]|nr:HAD family hydrolase [Kiritimatiellia bacterium]MDD5520016.1 HAD family hydrolase [Kiritimatiellia bacterium]